jgi:hypothetical protein
MDLGRTRATRRLAGPPEAIREVAVSKLKQAKGRPVPAAQDADDLYARFLGQAIREVAARGDVLERSRRHLDNPPRFDLEPRPPRTG